MGAVGVVVTAPFYVAVAENSNIRTTTRRSTLAGSAAREYYRHKTTKGCSVSLPQLSPVARRSTRARTDPAVERVHALVTQIDHERLDAAEALLAGVLAHQAADSRGLSASEVQSLARFGVTETELREPTPLAATTRGMLWDRQVADRSATVTETAEMLGVTAARVRQRCAAGSLLAQRRSDGWYLPRFQFPHDRELNGWGTVARAIPAGTPMLLAERVLTSPAPSLRGDGEELAPFEWLAQGGDPAAAAIAVDDALHRLP